MEDMFKNRKQMKKQLEQQKKIEGLEKALDKKEPAMSRTQKEILDKLEEEESRKRRENRKKEIENLREEFTKENKKINFDPNKTEYLYNISDYEWRKGVVLDYEVKAYSYQELYTMGVKHHYELRALYDQDQNPDMAFEIYVRIHLIVKIDEYKYIEEKLNFPQEYFDRYVMDVTKINDRL